MRWSKSATMPLTSDNETWITSFLKHTPDEKSAGEEKIGCLAAAEKRDG